MVFNADHVRRSMYVIGFQPALKISDVEIWVHTTDGLYASLWWVGDEPEDSPLLQSEHVGFFLGRKKNVEAFLEPGVMRTYINPTHELWTTEEEDIGNEID